MIVDDDAAALGDGEITVTAEGILRANAGGEDHHIHFQLAAVGKGEAVFRLLAAMHQDLAGALAGVHLHAHGFNLAAQQLAALTVELLGHQYRSKLHHMGLETQRLEGAGGFEAKQTAPDHHPALAAPGGAANGFQILDGAIDEALVVLAALEGWLGSVYGSLGVIHADREAASLLPDVEKTGARLLTKLGTPVSAGGGYPGTAPTPLDQPAPDRVEGERWLYASPALFGYRGSVFTDSALDRAKNDHYAVATRLYVVGHDPCGVAAVRMTI